MGLIDKTKEKVAETRGKVAEKVADLKDQATHLASDTMEASIGKARDAISDVNDALPIVSAAGWSLGEVSVQIGLPPKIIGRFMMRKVLSDQELEELCVEHADKRLAVMLVKTLHQARRLQDSVHIGNLKPSSIAITLGIIPTVEVRFE